MAILEEVEVEQGPLLGLLEQPELHQLRLETALPDPCCSPSNNKLIVSRYETTAISQSHVLENIQGHAVHHEFVLNHAVWHTQLPHFKVSAAQMGRYIIRQMRLQTSFIHPSTRPLTFQRQDHP